MQAIRNLQNAGKRDFQARNIESGIRKYRRAYDLALEIAEHVQKRDKRKVLELIHELERVILWYQEYANGTRVKRRRM